MGIVRNISDITTMPPDIYINERPVAQNLKPKTGDSVLAVVGAFSMGPRDKYTIFSARSSLELAEKVSAVYGPAVGGAPKANQMLAHIAQSGIRHMVAVRVCPKSAACAAATVKDRASAAVSTLKFTYLSPGVGGNKAAVEILDGTIENTFTLVLTNELSVSERYENLTVAEGVKNNVEVAVNGKSNFFSVTNLKSASSSLIPALGRTVFMGGNAGSTVSAADYTGSASDKAGLILLESAGGLVTDIVIDDIDNKIILQEVVPFAVKNDLFAYVSADIGTLTSAINFRNEHDCDSVQFCAGTYTNAGGMSIHASALSALCHVGGFVADSGLARECTWLNGGSAYTNDELTSLYNAQIATFTRKPSGDGSGNLTYRMSSDYTAAKTDIDGTVIFGNTLRKVVRRRLNLWIERALINAIAPFQGKAFTEKVKNDAENMLRIFFDLLKSSGSYGESPKIEDYDISFDYDAMSIDEFLINIRVKHFNTAEWILLNYQGGSTVTLEGDGE